jgi:tetratricopeptide (TPR) repeat protein
MMLELIREFALEQLAQAPDDALAHAQQRHAEYYAHLFEVDRPDADVIHLGEAEQHNAQAALRWLIDQQHALAVPLVRMLSWYFLLSGSPSQGLRWLKAVWASNIKMDALDVAGLCRDITDCSWHLHDFTTALDFAHRALATYRKLGQLERAAMSAMVIGRIYIEVGDYEQSRRWLLDAVHMAQSIHDDDALAGMFAHLGEVELSLGNIDSAEEYFDKAYGLCYSHGLVNDLMLTLACIGRGEVAFHRQNYALALECLREGLTATSMLRARLLCLDVLAGIIATMPRRNTAHVQRAAKIWGAVEAQRATTGLQPAPGNRARIDALITEARTRVTPKVFIASWTEGRALSLAEAIALAQE